MTILSLSAVLPQLAEDLTLPKTLTEPMVSVITTQYDSPLSDLQHFFTEKFATLDDYEVDLLLSPLFTPTLAQKLRYISLLKNEALSKEQLAELLDQTLKQNLSFKLSAPSGEHVNATLHSVNAERFIKLLGLTQSAPTDLFDAITRLCPPDEQPEALLLARDTVWQGLDASQLPKANIFIAFLKVWHNRKTTVTDKARALTDFVRTYRPSILFDVERQLESLIRSCESDLQNVASQSFLDPQLKANYSDSELAHFKDNSTRQHYETLLRMGEILKEDYSQIAQVWPDYIEQLRQPQQA